MKLLHNRAADAAADTGRHLNETLVNAPAFNIAQHGNAVVNTVYCHVCVITVAAIHRLKDTAGGGEQARTAVLLRNNLFSGSIPFSLNHALSSSNVRTASTIPS